MATTGTGQGGSSTGSGKGARNTGGSQTTGERDRRAAGTTAGSGAGAGDSVGGGSASGMNTGSGGNSGDSGIAETLRNTTYRSIDNQKERASETLGSLAGAVRGMTQPLRDGGQPQIADYANKAADGIERWASDLRQRDLEDAMRAVQQFARRQPAMFLGLAFGAGLLAARFLKSSSEEDSRNYGNFNRSGGGPSSFGPPDYGSSGIGVARTRGTGTTTGDIPRLSGDIRPAGEVL